MISFFMRSSCVFSLPTSTHVGSAAAALRGAGSVAAGDTSMSPMSAAFMTVSPAFAAFAAFAPNVPSPASGITPSSITSVRSRQMTLFVILFILFLLLFQDVFRFSIWGKIFPAPFPAGCPRRFSGVDRLYHAPLFFASDSWSLSAPLLICPRLYAIIKGGERAERTQYFMRCRRNRILLTINIIMIFARMSPPFLPKRVGKTKKILKKSRPFCSKGWEK